jgi:hypothetical protein
MRIMHPKLFCFQIIAVIFINVTSAQYYPIPVVEKGKKCIYVDMQGNTVIQGKYEHCLGFTEDGTALVATAPRYKECLLFDLEGNEIVPETEIDIARDFVTGMPRVFQNNMLCLKQNGKWGAINSKGKIAVPFEYGSLVDFEDDYAIGRKSRKHYVIHKSGATKEIQDAKITTFKHFSEGLAIVEVGEKNFGYVDTLGIIVIEPQFYDAGYFREGIAWVETQDRSMGCINKEGEWVVKPEFRGIGDFNGGFAWVRTQEYKIGFVNTKGQFVIEPQFDRVYHFDRESGLAMVQKNDEWMYCDTLGNIQNFNLKQRIYSFSEGLAMARKDDLIGFINNKGEWIIEAQFETARGFQNGIARVEKDGKWGLIDKEGNWVLLPKYKEIGGPSTFYPYKFMDYYMDY